MVAREKYSLKCSARARNKSKTKSDADLVQNPESGFLKGLCLTSRRTLEVKQNEAAGVVQTVADDYWPKIAPGRENDNAHQ